jgi:hypothetical protein
MERTSPVAEIQSICIALPQLLARLDVEKRQAEENYGEQQHHSILHSKSPSYSRASSNPQWIAGHFKPRPIKSLAATNGAMPQSSGMASSKGTELPRRNQFWLLAGLGNEKIF